MNQQYIEQEGIIVDFKDFIWKLFEQWKAILVCAMVVMLLFATAMHFLRENTEAKAAEETKSIETGSPEELFSGLAETDKAQIMSVYQIKKEKEELENYIDKSLYMKMNAYDLWELKVAFTIDTEESNYWEAASGCVNFLQANTFTDFIKTAWEDKYENEQIAELIVNNESTNYINDAKKVISFSLLMPDDVNLEQTKTAVEQGLNAISKELSSAIGNIKISIVSEKEQFVSDASIGQRQADIFIRLNNLNNQLDTLSKTLSAEQKAIYENLLTFDKAMYDVEGQIASEANDKNFFSKKDLIVGFILGCLLYMIAFLSYIVFGERIQSAEALKSYTNIRTLGEWYSDKKNPLLSDRIVYKSHHKETFDKNGAINRVTEAVSFMCNKNGYKNIAITHTCEMEDEITTFIAEIKRLVSLEEGVSIKEVPFNQSIGEHDIRDNEGIIIPVIGNRSSIKTIKNICEKCDFYGVPILGFVYFE